MGEITNILILHETSDISGAENSLLGLVKNIDKLRFNPVFVLPREGPLFLGLRALGVEVYIIALPKIRRGLGVSGAINKLIRLVKEKNIGLIHSNSIRTHIYGIIAARSGRIPAVWHQRNLITNEIFDADRLLFFLPERIICNSFAVARRFLKKGNLPDKVRVIYNGVDTESFNPHISSNQIREEFNINPGQILVGIVSRFHPIKGHEMFFRAAEILLKNFPALAEKIMFLVVGGAVFNEDKYMERRLRDIANRLGLGGKIIFTGVRQDMPQLYASMDIFVLTSHKEACARAVLEAMACGKPIIAVNAGGTPELVEEGVTGFLTRPENPEAIAEKIAFLAENTMLAKKMGQEARRRAEEKFSIKRNAEEIQKVYAELVEITKTNLPCAS